MNILTLDRLLINQSAIVAKINSSGLMRRRLMDIGIVPGTKLKCVLSSPIGNPRAYFVKESLIALRTKDAMEIEVDLIWELL